MTIQPGAGLKLTPFWEALGGMAIHPDGSAEIKSGNTLESTIMVGFLQLSALRQVWRGIRVRSVDDQDRACSANPMISRQ